MNLFRSPLLWIAAVAVAIAAAAYSFTHFTRAFPTLNQPVTMDRQAAVRAAEVLASKYHWSPGKDARAAAQLTDNFNLTSFIELEAGGKANLAALVAHDELVPDRWLVRLFRPKDASETVVEFSPQGTFLGFGEKLPDAQPGKNLAEPEARALAEIQAKAMGLSLAGFKLVASTDNRVSSGRIDRTFTYERSNPHLGAGREQRVLVVRGDRFCGFGQGVKIPDEFFSRFSVMRASNTNMSIASWTAIVLILILGGVVGGLIYVGRTSRIAWRGPLLLSAVLGTTAGLSAFSAYPLLWFGYNTSTPGTSLVLRFAISLVVQIAAMALFAPVFAAAEGLSRSAFPGHPRIWSVLSPRAAGTRPVVGAIIGGYLLSVMMFGYDLFIQIVGAKHLGWWVPSQTLFSPALLSMQLPWAPPLHNALLAGVFEECLFRAVPLASAVILGRRYGRKGLWIIGALVLEALVFGAAHSSYPTMPGWARMVELLIPALVFGLLYLNFGLLPGMVMHFSYDVLCMGLPLYTAHVRGSVPNSLVLGGLALAPLAWVTYWRIRARAWRELPDDLRYAIAAARPPAPAAPPMPEPPRAPDGALSPGQLLRVFWIGVAALAVWVVSMHTHPDYPPLTIGKSRAIADAHAVIAREGVDLGAQWKPLARVQYQPKAPGDFVWERAGSTTFHQILGTYLTVPGWEVRFVRDTVKLPDRIEEYRVLLSGSGAVQSIFHVVPDSRALPSLDKAAAQQIAEAQLTRAFGLHASALTPVSADEIKQPKRSDWAFVWKDPRIKLGDGEARAWVRIAGNQVAGYGRFVFVPEAWIRAKSAKDLPHSVTAGILGLLMSAGVGAGLVGMLARWKRRPFAMKAALSAGLLMAAVTAIQTGVKLPEIIATMSTAETLQVQTIRSLVIAAVSVVIGAAGIGLLAGVGANRTVEADPRRLRSEFLAGLGAGFVVVLAKRGIDLALPHWFPWSSGIDGADAGIPYLGSFWIVGILITHSLLALSVQRSVDAVARDLRLRFAIFAGFGFLVGAISHETTWTGMLVAAAVMGLAYPLLDRLVIRSHPSVIIAIFTALGIGDALSGILLPGQPRALGDGLVGIAAALLVGWLLFRWMRPGPLPTPTVAVTAPTVITGATEAAG